MKYCACVEVPKAHYEEDQMLVCYVIILVIIVQLSIVENTCILTALNHAHFVPDKCV